MQTEDNGSAEMADQGGLVDHQRYWHVKMKSLIDVDEKCFAF